MGRVDTFWESNMKLDRDPIGGCKQECINPIQYCSWK